MTICDMCKQDVKTRIKTAGCGSLKEYIKVCKSCYNKLHICYLSYEDCIKNLKEINAEHLITLLNKD